ncbi:MAG: zf-HC2 domain-containing protein [Anaerolineae bacterium]|nr:zf-HC2 domain-containing protein [Anaerolineae bacterium]
MSITQPCPKFSEQISLALDHQLSQAEEQELREHLRTCQACRAQWEALQRVDRLFAATPLVAPPDGFPQRVYVRLSQQESRRQIAFGVVSLVLGALIMGSIALASVGQFMPFLYFTLTSPAAEHYLTVIRQLLSLGESVLNALRLLLFACVRSPAVMICVTYSLIILALNVFWLQTLTRRLWRPVRVPHQE